MSLAPGERRTLAHIEDSLCRSDPRLATWLTKFRLPARLRLTVSCKRLVMRITGSGRPARRRRLTRLAVTMAGAALLGLIVAGGFAVRNARPPLCTGHGVRDGAFGRVYTCRPRGSGVAGKLPGPVTAAARERR